MKTDYKALNRDVLVVAKEGRIKDWAAYIGAVPGKNHDEEWKKVMEEGAKLDERIATILFPDFAEEFIYMEVLTWRY